MCAAPNSEQRCELSIYFVLIVGTLVWPFTPDAFQVVVAMFFTGVLCLLVFIVCCAFLVTCCPWPCSCCTSAPSPEQYETLSV